MEIVEGNKWIQMSKIQVNIQKVIETNTHLEDGIPVIKWLITPFVSQNEAMWKGSNPT